MKCSAGPLPSLPVLAGLGPQMVQPWNGIKRHQEPQTPPPPTPNLPPSEPIDEGPGGAIGHRQSSVHTVRSTAQHVCPDLKKTALVAVARGLHPLYPHLCLCGTPFPPPTPTPNLPPRTDGRTRRHLPLARGVRGLSVVRRALGPDTRVSQAAPSTGNLAVNQGRGITGFAGAHDSVCLYKRPAAAARRRKWGQDLMQVSQAKVRVEPLVHLPCATRRPTTATGQHPLRGTNQKKNPKRRGKGGTT